MLHKNYLYVFFIPLVSLLNGMDFGQDANGYQYKNEHTVQDKRNIMVLAYGSLINQSTNQATGAKLLASAFSQTPLVLPVALARKSSGNRITAVIDNQLGQDKKIWAAVSNFKSLPNARNNLAAREGVSLRNSQEGYDLTNIFYMKKLLAGRQKDNNEEVIPDTQNWVIRTSAHARQRLPAETAKKIAQWAESHNSTAVIWASFPPTFNSLEAVKQELSANAELLHTTQQYIRTLPAALMSPFEQTVLQMAPASSAAHAVQPLPSNSNRAIMDRFPRLFNGIPAPLQEKILSTLFTSPAAERTLEVTTQRYNEGILQSQILLWETLAHIFGFTILPNQPYYFYFQNVDTGPFSHKRLQDYIRQENVDRGEAQSTAAQLAESYKIHLMPKTDVNPTAVAVLLLQAMADDPELKKLVYTFKIAYQFNPHQSRSGNGVLPRVVVYPISGKNSAQKVLDKIYKLFENHPEIQGSGDRPRYNGKVNDLIWIAQGDGDNKTDEYARYYEPSRIYYRPDFTGRVENYHLQHPATGQAIVA